MKPLFPVENKNARASKAPFYKDDLWSSHSTLADDWELIKLELYLNLGEKATLELLGRCKLIFSEEERLITFVLEADYDVPSFKENLVFLAEKIVRRLALELHIEIVQRSHTQSKAGFVHFSDDDNLNNNTNPSQEDTQDRGYDVNRAYGYPRQEDEDVSNTKVNSQNNGEAPPLFTSSLAKNARLNPNYTFNTFIQGPSNQFALASCLNAAENPGVNYNPLFLYGSTGLGKTHLLHSVGNRIKELFPHYVIAYISSERFMNEMIYCIRHNKMWNFRQKYRHCDLFLMDDIQFISGNKAATQEEFFHTFNSLYEAKKQIIITSDLFPKDIPDIEERLRNRFQWGLIADIQPPDVEHRIAILKSKADQLKVALNDEVAEYIANHAKRNVRELEGALHRIAAFAALQGRPLDKAIAMETFHSMVADSPKQLEIETVQKAVADYFKLRVVDLKSKKRQRVLTLPRQIAMYLSRKHTQASFPDIGDKFGGKDHTTVMHAVRKIKEEKNRNLDLKANIEALERSLEKLR